MPHSSALPDFAAILEVLARHKVDFIVVGGIAANLQGASISTLDIDIVHSRTASNVERLLLALADLEAIYRIQPERRLAPNASHLSSGGHNLLLTKHGPLDVLGTIGNGHTWEELSGQSDTVQLDSGLIIAVLDLPTQIAIKEEVAGAKDALALPILRRTLELKRLNSER